MQNRHCYIADDYGQLKVDVLSVMSKGYCHRNRHKTQFLMKIINNMMMKSKVLYFDPGEIGNAQRPLPEMTETAL